MPIWAFSNFYGRVGEHSCWLHPEPTRKLAFFSSSPGNRGTHVPCYEDSCKNEDTKRSLSCSAACAAGRAALRKLSPGAPGG
jgi:hypothetical protein